MPLLWAGAGLLLMEKLLLDRNAGHSSLFKDFQGRLRLSGCGKLVN
ncbi:MAG: hypothetical protein ACE3JP_13620 [Ectobacillus sp.]